MLKNDTVNYDDAIRKNWVSKVNDKELETYKGLPRELRFALYREMDSQIKNKLLELIIKERVKLEESGVEKMFDEETRTYRYGNELDIEGLIEESTLLVLEELGIEVK